MTRLSLENKLTKEYGEVELGDYDVDHLVRACKKWEGSYQGEDSLKGFADFLGYPFDPFQRGRIVPTYLPEVRDIIDKINGPYGDAILKMLEIKNAEKAKAGSGS